MSIIPQVAWLEETYPALAVVGYVMDPFHTAMFSKESVGAHFSQRNVSLTLSSLPPCCLSASLGSLALAGHSPTVRHRCCGFVAAVAGTLV